MDGRKDTVSLKIEIEGAAGDKLDQMDQLAKLDKELSNCEKAGWVGQHLGATIVTSSTVGYVINTFVGKIPVVGPVLQAANEATGGILYPLVSGSVGRSLSPWDPSAAMTPAADAGKCKKVGGYVLKYSVKLLGFLASAFALTQAITFHIS